MTSWNDLHRLPQHNLRYPAEPCVRFLASIPSGHVLDLGCGAGRHSRTALEMGHRVTAYDIAPAALERTGRVTWGYGYHNVTLVQGCMTALPFGDGAFDSVMAYGSLYYTDWKGVQQAMGEVRRVVKPGGQAFIVTRTMHDRRCHGRRTGIVTAKTGEEGMTMTFLHAGDLRLLLREWSSFTIDMTETTRNGARDSDWLVTATR